MITKALIDLVSGLASFVLGLMPAVTLPNGIASISSTVHNAFGAAGVWATLLPLMALKVGFTFLLACWGIVVVIRLVRMLASFLTGGGGSVV